MKTRTSFAAVYEKTPHMQLKAKSADRVFAISVSLLIGMIVTILGCANSKPKATPNHLDSTTVTPSETAPNPSNKPTITPVQATSNARTKHIAPTAYTKTDLQTTEKRNPDNTIKAVDTGGTVSSDETVKTIKTADTNKNTQKEPKVCNCTIDNQKADESLSIPNCIIFKNNKWTLKNGVQAQLTFSGKPPLAEIMSNCGAFYANQKGGVQQTQVFDNGPDYFIEGITRVVQNNKFGYMKRNLKPIVKPIYEFAWPFECGFGKVCNHCKTIPSGEHTIIQCNSCGLVNKKGKLVVPLGATQEALNKKRGKSKACRYLPSQK